jgi:hypothetical protein
MRTYIVSLEASAAHPSGRYYRESASKRIKAPSRDAALHRGILHAEALDTYAKYANAYGWTAYAEAEIAGVA